MQDAKSIVLCSAISEVFLRKLAKQGFIRYKEGSEFVGKFFSHIKLLLFYWSLGPGSYLKDRQNDKGVSTTPQTAPGLPAPFLNYLPNTVLIR